VGQNILVNIATNSVTFTDMATTGNSEVIMGKFNVVKYNAVEIDH